MSLETDATGGHLHNVGFILAHVSRTGGTDSGRVAKHTSKFVGYSVALAVEQGVPAHHRQLCPMDVPILHISLNLGIHFLQIPHIRHPVCQHPVEEHRVLSFLFNRLPLPFHLEGRHQHSRTDKHRRRNNINYIFLCFQINPMRRAKSIIKSAVPSTPKSDVSTHRSYVDATPQFPKVKQL